MWKKLCNLLITLFLMDSGFPAMIIEKMLARQRRVFDKKNSMSHDKTQHFQLI